MDRPYISGEKVIAFWSTGKKGVYELSNFQQINGGIKPFDDNISFISAEHAYQSRKFIESDRKRFGMSGDLGNIDGFRLVFGEKTYKSKQDYWMKKSNIGIIAKMATNTKNVKKLCLHPIIDFRSTNKMWMEILYAKYIKEPYKQLLKNTGTAYLLEFDRGSQRKTMNGNPPIWAGMIIDNKLYGKNLMGKYLMHIRKCIVKFEE